MTNELIESLRAALAAIVAARHAIDEADMVRLGTPAPPIVEQQIGEARAGINDAQNAIVAILPTS